MAKDKKDKKAKAEKVESKKEAAPEFKYGVQDLADKLGIEPASVRVKLRNAGVAKAGKSYGWNTKADLDEVIEELKGDGDEKPAKKAKAKKDDAPKSEKKSKDKGKKAKKAKPTDDEDDDDDD
jgi:hypothetical protein